MTTVEKLGAWPARAAWIVLALAGQASVADAVADRSTAVGVVVWALLGALWTGGLVALLVPRTASLTAVRFIVPAGLAVAGAAAMGGGSVDWVDLLSVTFASIAVAAILAPWFTEAWVDGSSYGAEKRLPLQTPPLLASVVVPLTWVAIAVSVAAGPLLLATRQWAVGVPALVAGVAVAWRGIRSMHLLSKRWVVLVPNGLVVHDPLTLPEPHLFPRTAIAAIGPAAADTAALDLTAGASGLALQIDMKEPVELLMRSDGRDTSTIQRSELLITPSRPARFLEHIRAHRIQVAA